MTIHNGADVLGRRRFLSAGLVAAVPSALSCTASAPRLPVAACGRPAVSRSTDEALHLATTGRSATRPFGKTGLSLPILGFGGAALPTAWGNPMSTDDRVRLVRHAYDRGVRYFDTAANYMESEDILGRALVEVRDEVYLVTKVEATRPEQVRGSVERSLGKLRTDRLDAVLLHGTPGVEQMTFQQAMRIRDELDQLRREGLLRHIGLSAHSYFDKALALIASEGFDLCMLACGYFPRGYNQLFSDRMVGLRESCLSRAHEQGMAVVGMKVVGAGMLGSRSREVVPSFEERRHQQLPGAAIRHALTDLRLSNFVIGMRFEEEVDKNVATVAGNVRYTSEDQALLSAFCTPGLQSSEARSLRVD